MTRYLGIDVGATSTRAALGDASGAILARRARPTPTTDSDAVAECLQALVRSVCGDAGVDREAVVAAGIAAVGPLDRTAGAVVSPANLPIEHVPLVDPIEALLDADIYCYNDATAGAIGERFYRDTDHPTLVFLTISTGIGAGAIVDGDPLVGATGNAAEAGHFALDPDGPALCGCGGAGHWEGYASGANLPDYARHLADTTAIETALDLDALDAATVYGAEDPLAEHVRERATDWHAQGVAILVHAFDPDLLTIGGTVAVENPEAVVDAVRDRLPTLVTGDPPPIELTALGDDAGVKGALACALTGGTGRRSPGGGEES